MIGDDEQRLRESRQYWDHAAATFDEEPDHGLRDPIVRSAWMNRLAGWLPTTRATILDVGCGTGSLSVVLAELGHEVTGIDLSPAMVARAEAKAPTAGQRITHKVMDAANPQLVPQRFDVIVCRHLLWALPAPPLVLRRWVELLAPAGRLLLIEGYWKTGGGLHSYEIVEALPASLTGILVQDLSGQPELWGGWVTDERYAVIADLSAAA
ncbi:MAG: methyltransferase domain-containing protein [Chloroflexi bacterium]|nr:methyltransferase domain-containing protein [Chloroflexota bacterium]